MRHTWVTNNVTGKTDHFARYAEDPHNGPRCKVCGFNFCKHCHPDGWFDNNCSTSAKPLPDGPSMSESEFDLMSGLGRALQGR